MVATVFPTPMVPFFARDNSGNPVSGGLLFTYQAGTTTKQATYTSSSGATPNTNPVVMNSRGEAQVWLDVTLDYKFVFSPAGDTDPPTNPFWTIDGIQTISNAATATKLQTARTIAMTGDVAWTSPSFDGSANVTAAGTLATVNSNVGSYTNANITVNAKGLITAASSGSTTLSYAEFQNQQANGTGSGESPSAATWTKRTLNTTITNTIAGASLASSQVTLPAGTYVCTCYGQAHIGGSGGGMKMRLRNTTNSSTILVGPSSLTTAAGDVNPLLEGTFVLSGSSVLEVDGYWTGSSGNTGGSGVSGDGEVAVYLDIVFTKLA